MNTNGGRIVFLDNARALVVLFVVLLHASCAYSEIITWWPAQEFPKEIGYTILILFFDLFCMPTLFFIAGYFAPGSLHRHGSKGFIIRKFKRLGIPFILLAVFYLPFLSYAGYLRRTEAPVGFFDFWLSQLSQAWRPVFVVLDSPEKGALHANDFAQWHLWFISLLLVFFLVYALIAYLRSGTPRPPTADTTSNTSDKGILPALLGSWLLIILSISAVSLLTPVWSWAYIGGYLLFQPTRLGQYLICFGLGIYAARKHWFTTAEIPGPIWSWLLVGLVADAFFMTTSIHIMTTFPPLASALLMGLMRSTACIAWLVVIIKASQKLLNSRSLLWKALSGSSYDIYLIHLPIMVGLQAVAMYVPVDFFIKVILESVITIAVCLVISRMIIKPYPVASVFLLMVFFGTLGSLLS